MNLLDRETLEQMETALPKTINIPPKIFNSRNNKLGDAKVVIDSINILDLHLGLDFHLVVIDIGALLCKFIVVSFSFSLVSFNGLDHNFLLRISIHQLYLFLSSCRC